MAPAIKCVVGFLACLHVEALRQSEKPGSIAVAAAPKASALRGTDVVDGWPTANASGLALAMTEYQRGKTMATTAMYKVGNATHQLNATSHVEGVEAPKAPAKKATVSFQGFVEGHNSGRGIWKWSNSLDAYERHFAGLAGNDVKVAEVGVQSGGSVLMWQAVLGEKCHVYGLDINKNCQKFTNSHTTITIGDQADPNMWANFFTKTAPKLDILVDDGGHEAHQMRVTLVEVFNRLEPGGFIAIEDIHGQHYVGSFFVPAAIYLGEMARRGNVSSIHVYPYLMIVHKAGESRLPTTELTFDPDRAVVDNFDSMWAEVASTKHIGGAVVLANPAWGSFHTTQGLTNFFSYFGGMHDFDFYSTPKGCEITASAYCRTTIINSPLQSMLSGVHIYSNYMVAEVPRQPPVITAVRHGTEWLSYA